MEVRGERTRITTRSHEPDDLASPHQRALGEPGPECLEMAVQKYVPLGGIGRVDREPARSAVMELEDFSGGGGDDRSVTGCHDVQRVVPPCAAPQIVEAVDQLVGCHSGDWNDGLLSSQRDHVSRQNARLGRSAGTARRKRERIGWWYLRAGGNYGRLGDGGIGARHRSTQIAGIGEA